MLRAGALPNQSSVRLDLLSHPVPITHTSPSSVQRGGTIRLTAAPSFANTLTRALARINELITSKLDDFFELSEYDWTPAAREDAPSMYLYELVNWLTTVVDSLVIKQEYKGEAYRSAVEYLEDCLMVRVSFPSPSRIPTRQRRRLIAPNAARRTS